MSEQKQNKTILPFYAMRLRHCVKPLWAVWAECMSCGRHEKVDAVDLIARLGPNSSIGDVSKHLRCSGCRSTFVNVEREYIGGD